MATGNKQTLSSMWEIKKRNNSLTLDKSTVTFATADESALVQVTPTATALSGVIVSVENTSVASAVVIDGKVQIVPKAKGTTNVLVTSPGDNNHRASETVKCAVNVQ